MSIQPFPSAESSVLVSAPARTVFARWKDFEAIPSFMEGLVSVKPLDGKQYRLVSETLGIQVVSVVEIVLEIPSRRIAWRTVAGSASCGVVQIDPVDAATTRVTLKVKYDPTNNPVDVEGRLSRSLQRFQEVIDASSVLPPAVAA